MSKKRFIVLLDAPAEDTKEGVRFAIQEAFGPDYTVKTVMDNPFDSDYLKMDYLDIYADAECYLDEYKLSEEQLVQIAIKVGDEERNNSEVRNGNIWDAAKSFGFIEED